MYDLSTPSSASFRPAVTYDRSPSTPYFRGARRETQSSSYSAGCLVSIVRIDPTEISLSSLMMASGPFTKHLFVVEDLLPYRERATAPVRQMYILMALQTARVPNMLVALAVS